MDDDLGVPLRARTIIPRIPARLRGVRVQGSRIGVGPALRKARALRGVSLREASRDTRIRPELLEALERERFEELLGEVYVRGALRSYSSYLGLDPEKVVRAYAAVRDEESPPAPPPPQAQRAAIREGRRRDQVLVALGALAVLVALAAFGFLSRSNSAPEPAALPSEPTQDTLPARRIVVAVTAIEPVEVTVRADDGPVQTFALREGESRAFEAALTLAVGLSDGGAAEVTVAGRELGIPGRVGRPWQETFAYEPGDATPSP